MEIEYFIPPGDEHWPRYHREWIDVRRQWFNSIGLTSDLLGEEVHPKHKLAHYAQACTDITFKFPFGEQNSRELLHVEILTLNNTKSIREKLRIFR